jgi:subtilase family serine protease
MGQLENKTLKPLEIFHREIFHRIKPIILERCAIIKKTIISKLKKNNRKDTEVISFACKMDPSASASINCYNSTPSIGFNGSHLLSLYNVPSVSPALLPNGTMAKKVKIAIIVCNTYPNLKADLYSYWTSPANFGPNSKPPDIKIYTMPGATYNSSWSIEECMDVQMVCTINPNADICVVEAVNGSVPNMKAAVDYASNTLGVDVISMSWGGPESTNYLQYSSSFSNPKICYCAATGDNNFASWPATLSNCIAVGGSTLLWTPNSNSQISRTEYTWSMAGCGISNMIEKPIYQNNVNSLKNRSIPDISLVANPQNGVYITNNGKWMCTGGTSIATPIFAGMLSIANQQRFNAGKPALTTVCSVTNNPKTNVQSCLYDSISSSVYNDMFTDIVLGSDVGTYGNSVQNFNSGIKYDVPTGLGSPNCANICNALFKL